MRGVAGDLDLDLDEHNSPVLTIGELLKLLQRRRPERSLADGTECSSRQASAAHWRPDEHAPTLREEIDIGKRALRELLAQDPSRECIGVSELFAIALVLLARDRASAGAHPDERAKKKVRRSSHARETTWPSLRFRSVR